MILRVLFLLVVLANFNDQTQQFCTKQRDIEGRYDVRGMMGCRKRHTHRLTGGTACTKKKKMQDSSCPASSLTPFFPLLSLSLSSIFALALERMILLFTFLCVFSVFLSTQCCFPRSTNQSDKNESDRSRFGVQGFPPLTFCGITAQTSTYTTQRPF